MRTSVSSAVYEMHVAHFSSYCLVIHVAHFSPYCLVIPSLCRLPHVQWKAKK